MQHFEPEIETFTLVPSDGGRFELEVNGELVFSKLKEKRHLEAGEALRLVRIHQKQTS